MSGFDDAPAGFGAHPFDEPIVDMSTGEILDDSPSLDSGLPSSEIAGLPTTSLADGAVSAIALAADVDAFAGELRRDLERRVDEQYGALVTLRPDGPVTEATVARELQWLADAHDVFVKIGAVFTEQARGVRSLAGDAVLEVRRDRDLERTGGSASVKVGARGTGEAVKVTATRSTDTFADDEPIVDVLVSHMLGRLPADAVDPGAYAAGARDMADALLGLHGVVGLLAAPKWKSTALDVLRELLESGDEPSRALAVRLRAAYGRRPVGNVNTKIERVPLAERRTI